MSYRLDPEDNSIVIEGWQNGIADSPYAGLSNVRNINITSVPGEAPINFATTQSSFVSNTTGNVNTANTTTYFITYLSGGLTGTLANGQAMTFSGAGLPGGIVAGTVYYIKNLDTGNLQFKLSNFGDLSDTLVITTGGTGGSFVSVDMGQPTQRATEILSSGSSNLYMLDANGRLWCNPSYGVTSGSWVFAKNTTLTNTNGNGLAVWKGYAIVFRNSKIDYIATTNIFTATWTYGWQPDGVNDMNTTAGTNNSHYTHIGQDDVVYYCDANYVGSLLEKTGQTFNPASSATYTWARQALKLPSTDIAQCLAELGINLLVGGNLNAVYPWDRTSTSYRYPILIGESVIKRIVTVNTNSYFFVGVRGRIYKTNGSQAELYKKVPDHIGGGIESGFTWGDAVFSNNQLYFGVLSGSQYGGIWAINLDTGALRLAHQLSYGTYAGRATALIANNILAGNGLFAGWTDGGSGTGIDIITANPYSGSQATIDSDLIPIGTFQKPRNFNTIEYKLSKPLVSGESITLKYRTVFNTSDTGYTTIFTDSTAGNLSGFSTVNFSNIQWLQIQVVLNGTNSGSFVRLKEIRIR